MSGMGNRGTTNGLPQWQEPSRANPITDVNTAPGLRLDPWTQAQNQARVTAGAALWPQIQQQQQPQQQYGQPMQQYGQAQQFMGANAPLVDQNTASALRLNTSVMSQRPAINPTGQAWWNGLLAQTLASQKPRTGGGDPNGGPEQYVMDPRISGG